MRLLQHDLTHSCSTTGTCELLCCVVQLSDFDVWCHQLNAVQLHRSGTFGTDVDVCVKQIHKQIHIYIHIYIRSWPWSAGFSSTTTPHGYLLIQAFFQALQSYSWGFALIQSLNNSPVTGSILQHKRLAHNDIVNASMIHFQKIYRYSSTESKSKFSHFQHCIL